MSEPVVVLLQDLSEQGRQARAYLFNQFSQQETDPERQLTAWEAPETDAGLRIIKSPPQAPKTNAHCKRLIGTLRRELLDSTLIRNEHHLRCTLTRYLAPYDTARPHRGIGQLSRIASRNRTAKPH
ncbi:integrase core domain-containing protein [Nonomuraea sp. KM90]|uniref:integrase core domain-containing protein n=1 Tax=Nonomuraea sp. KM90 TaxID=3457428 RepID=UPI003FCC85EE